MTVTLKEEADLHLFAVRTVIEAPSGYRFEAYCHTFPTLEWAERAYAQQQEAWINK